MALDESRAFLSADPPLREGRQPPRLAGGLWFRDVHWDVGGGNGNRGLTWSALHWMFMNARHAGLPIAQEAIDRNLADRALPPQISDHNVDAQLRRTFFANDCLQRA